MEAVIRCEGPAPRIVNELIVGLPDTSLTAALAAGGQEHYGWGYERHTLTSILEQLILRRHDGDKNFKFKPVPRPKGRVEVKEKGSILDQVIAKLSAGR